MERSETAARAVSEKQSRDEEPPIPWLQSSDDTERRSSSERSRSSSERSLNDVISDARPPSVPPGKRTQVHDGQLFFVDRFSLSSVLSRLS